MRPVLARLLMTAGALAVAAAVGGVGLLGERGLAVVVVAACAVVGLGWTRLLDVPVGWGIGVVVTGTGAATVAVHFLGGPELLGWLPAALGVAVLVAFGHQMVRRDGRPRLVESVSATITGQMVAVLGAGWLVALTLAPDGGVNAAGAAGCAAAAVISAVPWPRRATVPVGLVASALAGAAAAGGFPSVEVERGLVIGAAAGLAAMGLDVLTRPSATTVRAALAAGVATVLTAGLAAYAMSRFVS
jgi:hypothetical protein